MSLSTHAVLEVWFPAANDYKSVISCIILLACDHDTYAQVNKWKRRNRFLPL